MPALTVEAAAIQVRILSSSNHEDSDEAKARRKNLLYSILNVLEAKGGGTRDQWAGDYYLPGYGDLFADDGFKA